MSNESSTKSGCAPLLWVAVALLGFICFSQLLALFRNTNAMGYSMRAAHTYDDYRQKAMQGDLANAATNLRYVIMLKHSGGKIPEDSPCAKTLDLYRASTIREIITRMRALSGEDLGDDPELWAQKFYREETRQPSTP